jgi:hypothetical protein
MALDDCILLCVLAVCWTALRIVNRCLGAFDRWLKSAYGWEAK